MKKILFALLALSACTAPASDVQRVLADQGMTNIKLTGHRWFGCGQHDDTADGFEATSIAGRPVTGVVCGSLGWGKAYTVRFD